LKANKFNLFVSSVLFVFWYHSPKFLDTPHVSHTRICLLLTRTPSHCSQPAHVKRCYLLTTQQLVPHTFNLQRIVSCENRRSSDLFWEPSRKSFSIWKPRNNIRPNVETSPTRPILYTSRKNLPHQVQLAGKSAPSRPNKNISHYGNLAGATVPYWKPHGDCSPIFETKQKFPPIIGTSQQRVQSWKTREKICPSLETSQGYAWS
jgi:hypothetical protein